MIQKFITFSVHSSLLEENQFQFKREESGRGQKHQPKFKEVLVNHGEGLTCH